MSFREAFEQRDALLAAGVEAFVGHGFEGVSLNAILATAEMSRGQFAHHFEGKEGLYLAVCEAMIDRKRVWFVAHPPPSTDGPFDALGAFAPTFTPAFVARAVGVVLVGAADLLGADDPEAGVEQVVALLRRGLGTAVPDRTRWPG